MSGASILRGGRCSDVHAKSNAKALARKIDSKKRAIHDETAKMVEKTAKAIRTTLYGLTPRAAGPYVAFKTVQGKTTQPVTHEDGGRARAAFTNKPREGGDAIFALTKTNAKVGTNVPYMIFLEHGTRAHGPKTKKFLRFPTVKGVVFTKMVKGIRPRKIFAKTEMMYARIWPKKLKMAVKEGLAK